MNHTQHKLSALGSLLACLVAPSCLLSPAHAQTAAASDGQSSPSQALASSSSSAAADAQNPIAHVVSIPVQANLYTRSGPLHRTAGTLLIEPVVPIQLNADWSVVTRTIIPLIHEPRTSLEQAAQTGLGNIEPQFYLTPAHPGPFIWGAGFQLWLPTATRPELGYNHWGAGPSFVGLTIRGPWVAGALLNSIWAGSGPKRVNELTFNPFVNYNMHDGWYLASTPIVTANWVKSGSDRKSVV